MQRRHGGRAVATVLALVWLSCTAKMSNNPPTDQGGAVEWGTGTCTASGCSGCCLNGQCRSGQEDTACGQGAVCKQCPAGTSCVGFRCTCVNCPGCCAEGGCLSGNDKANCGVGGGPCRQCGPDDVCFAGVCQAPPSTCDTTNCATGCCNGKTCVGNPDVNFCGAQAQPCGACNPQTQVCRNGECVSNACGPASCPGGCCQDGQCIDPPRKDACGTGGGACRACDSATETCGSSGCVEKTCSNCSMGCCSGGSCISDTSDEKCGRNGEPCQRCSAPQTCVNGSCEDAPGKWTLVALSASIAERGGCNLNCWDPILPYPNEANPDPYLKATVGATSGSTEQALNTYEPDWQAKELLTLSAEAYVRDGIAGEVLDRDEWTGGDDSMGSFNVTFSSLEDFRSNYAGQEFTITTFAAATEIKSVKLKLVAAP